MSEIDLETISHPDSLMTDEDSMGFYVLKDETIALHRSQDELPYHKNRSTYLSSGRYSPKYRVVVFWPGSINPQRAFTLLMEQELIDATYSLKVSGAVTRIKSEPKGKIHPGIDRHDSVRKAEIGDLMKRGMRIQNDQSTEKRPDEAQAD